MAQHIARLGEGEEESLTWDEFQRFVHAPRRRPLTVIVPWAVIIVLSAVSLFFLPKKYKSSTLILVESEKMPDSFVPKMATDDRTDRLAAIRPEILSRTRLEAVLEETQPYPEIASKVHAVEKMRSAIYINESGNDGFSIDFVHSDPHKAQLVADRLATLFISESIKSRTQQVEGAVDFLVTQVAESRKELEKKDEAVRRYKEQHMGRLPEQLQTNLATLGMLQRELQTIEESLLFARERQEALQRGSGRAAAPAADPGSSSATSDVADLRRQLAALRSRYTEEHPDVQRLRARIARIETRLAETAPASAGDVDPSVIAAREQRERANLEVKRLDDKRIDIERKIASLRYNVEETPRTEQDLATLTRDYEKLNENYAALLSKQMEAQMAGRLERRWKGDRFRVLDPASLPEKPYFPKPWLVIGLGIALGLFVGLGVSMLAEYFDATIRDSQDLEAAQAFPVLASIPHAPVLALVAAPPPRPGRLLS
jgi:polysaccharide chain length determinant protein (PEP-CTERM system associated)